MTVISSSTRPGSSIAAQSWIQRHPLFSYFAIAFAGTWALTIPLALSTGFNLFTLPDIIFILLFIFSIYLGPLLGGLFVTRTTEGKEEMRRLLKRILPVA